MSDTKTVIVDCPSCGHAMGWTKGETLRPGDVCDICEATQDKDLRIADLERQLSEARAERDAFRASRDRLLDQRDEDVAKVVDQWKRRTEAAESRVSVLEGALGKVIAEVDFKLSGGDNPVERCGECGEYGAGMLRDVVNAARDALSNKLPTGTTPDAGGSTGEVIAGSTDPQRTVTLSCGRPESHRWRNSILISLPPLNPEGEIPPYPQTSEEVQAACRRGQQWCHLCERFDCCDNTAPRCPQHPKAPGRRFGNLWRCSECGDAYFPPAPPASQEPERGTEKTWTWGVSRNEERFSGHYASEAEALASAASELELKPGDRFWVGGGGLYQPRPVLNADHVLELYSDAAGDDCGEIAEDWPTIPGGYAEKDLEQRLHAVVMAWLGEQNDLPNFYNCEKVTEYTVPATPAPSTDGKEGTRTCPDCDYALRPTHNGTDSMRCPECNVEYPPAPSTDGKEGT